MRVVVVEAIRILRERELTRIRSEPDRRIARSTRRIVTCTTNRAVAPRVAFPALGLVLGILINPVNWFVLPSELDE
jgi:hypothetical protein